MTVTVRDLIAALSKMPQDATVILRGSNETYDGYSHPSVELDADGEVVITEADEPEDYDPETSAFLETLLYREAIEEMRLADKRI
jgi:hypothetical protein